jgi:hypothetical protein
MAQDRYNALSINQEGTKPTYSAAVTGFTPVANATDYLSIGNPSGSNLIVKVTHINVSGIATAGAAVTLQVIKRSTLDTGGTPTALTAVPYDSKDVAATAVVNTYAANPTLGTTVGTLKSTYWGVGTSGSTNIQEQTYDFATKPTKAITLRAGECIALNANGVSPGAGSLYNIDIEWTEEQING